MDGQRRTGALGVLCIAAAMALGCGKSNDQSAEKKPEPQPVVRTQGPFDRPEHIPPPRSADMMSEAILDTLRRLKKLHNVTRDETWTGKGGVLANDYFEVWYPEGRTSVTHGMRVLNDMMYARAELEGYFGQAPLEPLVVLLPPYLEVFTQWTGREFWFYSEIQGDTMTVQPVHILMRRGLIDYALPHEYFQWAVGRMTAFGAPRWLEEGIASYLCGEGKLVTDQLKEFPVESHAMTPERVEEVLVREESRQDSRIAYYHAYRMVKSLIDRYGEDTLKEMILLLSKGHTMDDACRESYGMSYPALLDVMADRTGS
jgi:hypothetical protein